MTSNSTIGKSEVNIFPNPTNGKLNIEISKKSILTLYNIYGQNLSNFKIEEGNNIIDLNGLSSGLYLLKIENTLYKIMKID
ncbi:MAG: T9SS type A sorting domain-containing protein [Saprospiraceae bacterium]|nr:T9SS type A sorting domain-containing protein [Saprospiraceae bacterium]